jgi:rubrerythrin
MAFNPLKEKGIPIEKQFKNWSELNTVPYDKDTVHPYTRTAGILMNGIEVEGAFFSHNFARHTDDLELRKKLALIRRIEQSQQKEINWMIPADESNLEVTIGYEQVAVDLTAYLAENEKDSYVKQALDFALLEDFDHLYRYANLMRITMGKDASSVTKQYTEITVGRPTKLEHRYPLDDVRKYADKNTADLMTILHILTIISAEQQTMNFYMTVGDRIEENIGRGLYLEIAQIEEQHVTHYESLLDPRTTWFEQLLFHELNECWLYYSLMQSESDNRAAKVWEKNLAMEIEHLKIAADLMKQYENRDPEELISSGFSHLFKFKSNIDYVRNILKTQYNYNAMDTEFVPGERLSRDHRYYKHQAIVNAGGVPSEEVIEKVIDKEGTDYRQEIAGPHPVEEYREKVATR